MTRRALLLLAALQAAALTAAPSARDAWIALGPPGSSAYAGYLTLHNPDAAAQALTAVSSPAFARIELHRTERDGDSMRMRPVPRLELPPGASVALAPGAVHLMLFGPRLVLGAGQTLDLVLRFADGSTLVVAAEVRDPRAAAPDHHSGTR